MITGLQARKTIEHIVQVELELKDEEEEAEKKLDKMKNDYDETYNHAVFHLRLYYQPNVGQQGREDI